jgi:aspartate carbamoyltransferase catalytic subunit
VGDVATDGHRQPADVADDLTVSLIQDQVEMGVAARMAVLAGLSLRREGAGA